MVCVYPTEVWSTSVCNNGWGHMKEDPTLRVAGIVIEEYDTGQKQAIL